MDGKESQNVGRLLSRENIADVVVIILVKVNWTCKWSKEWLGQQKEVFFMWKWKWSRSVVSDSLQPYGL